MHITGHVENTAPTVVAKASLPRHCLAIEVQLFHARVLRECVYQAIAYQWVYMLLYCPW
jgi:hypothetical protein